MQATREDFEKFLMQVKRAINDKNIDTTQVFDFKDYSEFNGELEKFLADNSNEKWTILSNFGIGITRNWF